MPREAIVGYSIGWYPGSNRARVEIELGDGTVRAVPVETAAELAAIVLLLDGGPCWLDEQGQVGRDGVVAPG